MVQEQPVCGCGLACNLSVLLFANPLDPLDLIGLFANSHQRSDDISDHVVQETICGNFQAEARKTMDCLFLDFQLTHGSNR